MWQKVLDDVGELGLQVIAVALDTADGARPWIEAAKPAYPALIDRDHQVAALYNMINVPEAVWIDESGQIVRPAENAGAVEGFRKRNRETGYTPPDVAETVARAKATYLDAVRDWARHGARSRHALSPEAAREHMRPSDPAVAEAHAHFRLAVHLLQAGDPAEAAQHFAEASRLHPASWAIWRQAAERNAQGFAAGPEFWARVDALGERRYYERVKMEGMP